MAKKNTKLTKTTDFTVENGDAEYTGCLEIKDGVTQLCQILDDDDDCSGERQFLADAVEVYIRENPSTPDDSTFVYNHKTKKVTLK